MGYKLVQNISQVKHAIFDMLQQRVLEKPTTHHGCSWEWCHVLSCVLCLKSPPPITPSHNYLEDFSSLVQLLLLCPAASSSDVTREASHQLSSVDGPEERVSTACRLSAHTTLETLLPSVCFYSSAEQPMSFIRAHAIVIQFFFLHGQIIKPFSLDLSFPLSLFVLSFLSHLG